MYDSRMASKKTPESAYKEGDFKKLAAKLKAKSGRDSGGLTAYIMRNKYGEKGFAHIQAKGRKAAAEKK
jgi:hypothetical protein